MGYVRLTWSLTPHSPAARVTRLRRRPGVATRPNGTSTARVASSPPAPDSRGRSGQGLPLSRTMLSDHKSPYVGRFACDWPRLSTTDPHAARPPCYDRPGVSAPARHGPGGRHWQGTWEPGRASAKSSTLPGVAPPARHARDLPHAADLLEAGREPDDVGWGRVDLVVHARLVDQ